MSEAAINAAIDKNVQLDAEIKNNISKQLHKVTKDGKVKRRAFLAERGVVFISRLPTEFTEEPMRKFFSQYGRVTRIRVSKSPKTGRSRHYGYIEFESREVAAIVAKSMNNYMLFNHVLQCELLDPSAVHPLLFKGSESEFVVKDLVQKDNEHRLAKTPQQIEKLTRKTIQKTIKKRKMLLEQYGYSFTPAFITEKTKSNDESNKSTSDDIVAVTDKATKSEAPEKAKTKKSEFEKAKVTKSEVEKAKVTKPEVENPKVTKSEAPEKAKVAKSEAEKAKVTKSEAEKAKVTKSEAPEKAKVPKSEVEKAKATKSDATGEAKVTKSEAPKKSKAIKTSESEKAELQDAQPKAQLKKVKQDEKLPAAKSTEKAVEKPKTTKIAAKKTKSTN